MPHKLPTQTHHTRTNTICSCPLALSRLCAVSTMWACTIQPPLLKVELHFQPNRCHASDLKKKKKEHTTCAVIYDLSKILALVFRVSFQHVPSFSHAVFHTETLGKLFIANADHRVGKSSQVWHKHWKKKKKALSSIPYALMMPAERKKMLTQNDNQL